MAGGLRFDSLRPVAAGQLPPQGAYACRDGTRLPLRHYPSSADRALVLIHGSGSHSRYLAPLAHAVAEAGVAHVFTPDLRGHGEHPTRRGDIDYVDQLEDDLADLIACVHERCPGARCVLGGHSSGGGLAVRFAGSRHRGLADGLLLLAPFLGHDAPTTRPGSGGWAQPKIPRIVALTLLSRLGIRAFQAATVITFAMPEAVRDGTETLAYSYRLNTGLAPRAWARDLSDLRVPLLALIGAEDEAFRPEQLAPALAGVPGAQVAVIERAGHLDLVGHPEASRRIAAWLAACD